MTTKLINLGEYRKNLSTLWKQGKEKNIRYLVTVHGEPAFEVKPVYSNIINDDWTENTEENEKAWRQARKELENGETIKIDFDKIKDEDDFISFLKK